MERRRDRPDDVIADEDRQDEDRKAEHERIDCAARCGMGGSGGSITQTASIFRRLTHGIRCLIQALKSFFEICIGHYASPPSTGDLGEDGVFGALAGVFLAGFAAAFGAAGSAAGFSAFGFGAAFGFAAFSATAVGPVSALANAGCRILP